MVQEPRRPRSRPLPVSFSTSQAWATPWVMLPEAESTWLANHQRKAGACNEPKARPRGGGAGGVIIYSS